MAFNNGFPVTYQPAYYSPTNPYYQQMQNPTMAQQAQQIQQTQQVQSQQVQQPAIQQSGFVVVPSDADVRSYPVAPGNAVTFKIENAPICYVKTMGFSQLESPTIERYRLVKEDDPITSQNTYNNENKNTSYALKSDLNPIWDEIHALKRELKVKSENKLSTTEDEEDE